MVAFSAVPVLGYQALVERKSHGAMSIPRRTYRADLPIAEPIIKLPICRIRSARIGISGGKAVCCERQAEQNGEKNGFRIPTLEKQDEFVHITPPQIESSQLVRVIPQFVF